MSLVPLYEALALVSRQTTPLEMAPDNAQCAIKEAIRSPVEQPEILMLLELLPYSWSLPLVPEVMDCAENARYADRARALLGRIPFAKARELVATEVARRLDAGPDDDWVFRRMAELLDYLGYYEELSDLVRRADASNDPDTRDVGDDYRSIDLR